MSVRKALLGVENIALTNDTFLRPMNAIRRWQKISCLSKNQKIRLLF